jgi:hypothetical protein
MSNTGIESSKVDKLDPFKRRAIGQVVANDDPKVLGRVKVEIPNMTKGLEIEALPWYQVMLPVGLGGSVYTSHFAVPQVNTMVVVEFTDESLYSGVVTGCLLNKVTMPDDKLNYGVDFIHSKSSEIHFTTDWDQVDDTAKGQKHFSPDMTEDYPFSHGWVDSAFNWFKVNMMKRTTEFVLNNFLRFKTYSDGNTILEIPGNFKLIITGDFYTEVRGSEDHIVLKDQYTHVLGNRLSMGEALDVIQAKQGMILKGAAVSIN